MHEDEFDGYFDTGAVTGKRDAELPALMDDISSTGMNKAKFIEGSNLCPGIFASVDARKLTEHPTKMGAVPALESYLGSMLPFISVRENSGIITIEGFPARYLHKLMLKHWRTGRITSNMFSRLTMRSISFFSFFAVEMLYIVNELSKVGSSQTRIYKDIATKLLTDTWLKQTVSGVKVPMNMGLLSKLNTSLLKSQTEFLETYRDKSAAYGLTGYLLAAPPGTGKTIAGYALSTVLDTDTTIFIVPNNSVEEVWVKTLKTRFKEVPTYWASSAPTYPAGDERYIICHYEAMFKLTDILSKLGKGRVNVWLDESHNLNEISSTRTNNFISLCRTVNSVSTVWASGTPLKAMGKEVVPLLRTIDKLFSPYVEARFLKIFGASTLVAADIVSHRIGNMMFAIDKSDVVSNDVETYDHPVVIPNPEMFTLDSIRVDTKAYVLERALYYKAQMPEYVATYNKHCAAHEVTIKTSADLVAYAEYRKGADELHKHFNPFDDRDKVVKCKQYETSKIVPFLIPRDKDEFRKSASVYKYVALTIRGEALGRVLTRRRIDCFAAMVAHARLPEIIDNAVKKTLIFTSYVEVAEALNKHLTKKGYKPLMVFGEHNKNLSAIMSAFKKDPRANPLIATFDSLSTAVPVIEASTCVLFNAPFRDYIRKQATSRVDRLGQDSPVTIVNVTLDTGETANISTRSSEIMEWSKEMVDALLGLGGDIED